MITNSSALRSLVPSHAVRCILVILPHSLAILPESRSIRNYSLKASLVLMLPVLRRQIFVDDKCSIKKLTSFTLQIFDFHDFHGS